MMIAEIHLPEIHQMKPWMEIDSYLIRRNTFPSISGVDMDGFKRRLMVCGAQQLAKCF